ncbi:hypothetical protein CsSME_00040826 [Camellia sinensis var. sinensis]
MKESRHRRPLSESLASLSIAITSKRSSSESLASLSSRDQQTKQTELSPLPLTGALAPFLPTTQFQVHVQEFCSMGHPVLGKHFW